MKKKTIALVLACILCVGIGVAGTLAWLTDTTDAVTNTFTTSNIDITLTEADSELDNDNNANTNSYKMVPGYTITKDPKVTVEAGSEACYLFVKIEESSTLDTYITYTVDSGWTELTVGSGIYYRTVAASERDQEFGVLTDNRVTVKESVTKANMDALNETGAVQPTLTFTAYASQLYKNNNATDNTFTAAEAWAKINSST